MSDRHAMLRLARRHEVSTAQAEAFLEFAGGNEAAASRGLERLARGMSEMQALAVVTALAGPRHRVGQLPCGSARLLRSLAGGTLTQGMGRPLRDGWRVLWRRPESPGA
ncbi:MAG: hypothetical protein QJR07_01620 [Acetobacteraceae bacterium]|nr:hypothetical protein [Acetobacteraceae bacterium]